MKMFIKKGKFAPIIDKSAFVAENATIVGNVKVGKKASIWYGVVLRGDCDSITIGENSNVQDNAVIHVDKGNPVVVGENVTIGHGAIVHACKVGSDCLIGMGAIILNGAIIGEGSIIGAGALVTKNTIIPPHSMVMGTPARIKREVTQEELEMIYNNAMDYVSLIEDMEG